MLLEDDFEVDFGRVYRGPQRCCFLLFYDPQVHNRNSPGKQAKQLQRFSRLSRDLFRSICTEALDGGACRPLLETTLASGRKRNNRAVWQVSGPETDPPASTRALTTGTRWPCAGALAQS